MGGDSGGGAALTPLGRRIVKHYRDMEGTPPRRLAAHLRPWTVGHEAQAG